MKKTIPVHRNDLGFTLVEVLLAFSILLIGMTGVITLFSAGLSLERDGSLAVNTGLIMDELMPEIVENLRKQVVAGQSGNLRVPRTAIPGRGALDYEVEAEVIPDDPSGKSFLVRLTLFAPGPRADKTYTLGWLPVVLATTYEERISEMSGKK